MSASRYNRAMYSRANLANIRAGKLRLIVVMITTPFGASLGNGLYEYWPVGHMLNYFGGINNIKITPLLASSSVEIVW